MKSSRRIVPLVLVLLAAFLSACGGDEAFVNHAPNIVSLLVDPENPAPTKTAQLKFNVLDVDGDPVTFRWETSGGEVRFEEGVAIWHVPDAEGRYKITLIASDGMASDRKTIDVRVWRPREGNYYPLAVGNEWELIDEAGNTITFSIVDTIQIEHTNITSYVLETKTTDPGVPDGVVNFSYLGRTKDGIEQHAVNVVFGSGDTLIFDPWLPLYRFPLIPGKAWSVKFKGFLPDGFFIGQGSASYRVVDESTLTTAAGTFEHVFQVEETFEWKLLDQNIDRTVSRKWLAPNVGIVQIDQEQTRGKQTQRTRAQLVSYKVLPDTSFDLIPDDAPAIAAAP